MRRQVPGATDADTSRRRRAVAGSGRRRARYRARRRTRPGPGRPRLAHDSDGEVDIGSPTAAQARLARAASFSRPGEGAPCKPLVTLHRACTLVGKVAMSSHCSHLVSLTVVVFQPCCCTSLQAPLPHPDYHPCALILVVSRSPSPAWHSPAAPAGRPLSASGRAWTQPPRPRGPETGHAGLDRFTLCAVTSTVTTTRMGGRFALGPRGPRGFVRGTCRLGPRPGGDAMGGRAAPDPAVRVGTCGGRAARPTRVSLGGRFAPAPTARVGDLRGCAHFHQAECLPLLSCQ